MFNKSLFVVILLLLQTWALAGPSDQVFKMSDLKLQDKYEIMLAYMTDVVITKSTEKEIDGLKRFVQYRHSLISNDSNFVGFFENKNNYWSGNGLRLAKYLLDNTKLLSLDSLYAQVNHESTAPDSIWFPRTFDRLQQELEALRSETIRPVQPKKKRDKKSKSSSSMWYIIIPVMILVVGLLIYAIYSWSRRMDREESEYTKRRQRVKLEKEKPYTPSGGAGIGPVKDAQRTPSARIKESLVRDSEMTNKPDLSEDENLSPTITLKVSDNTQKVDSSFSSFKPVANKDVNLVSNKFFGTPREDGSFQLKEEKKNGDPLVLYRLEGHNSGKIYIEIASSHSKIIEARNRLIEPVCESINAFEIGKHTRIKLVEPGSYVTEGDKLRVDKKVKIQYY